MLGNNDDLLCAARESITYRIELNQLQGLSIGGNVKK
jgi:hypothetical protein